MMKIIINIHELTNKISQKNKNFKKKIINFIIQSDNLIE